MLFGKRVFANVLHSNKKMGKHAADNVRCRFSLGFANYTVSDWPIGNPPVYLHEHMVLFRQKGSNTDIKSGCF